MRRFSTPILQCSTVCSVTAGQTRNTLRHVRPGRKWTCDVEKNARRLLKSARESLPFALSQSLLERRIQRKWLRKAHKVNNFTFCREICAESDFQLDWPLKNAGIASGLKSGTEKKIRRCCASMACELKRRRRRRSATETRGSAF